jgi:hypothetical protein
MKRKTMTEVINLADRRRKKEMEEALARGRVPLMTTHNPMGSTSGHSVPPPPPNDSFADRILRIKASLEKINTLMAELKKQHNPKD